MKSALGMVGQIRDALGMSSAQPAADTGPIAQIERLAKLRDMGAISTEEFEAKKAELLKQV